MRSAEEEDLASGHQTITMFPVPSYRPTHLHINHPSRMVLKYDQHQVRCENRKRGFINPPDILGWILDIDHEVLFILKII